MKANDSVPVEQSVGSQPRYTEIRLGVSQSAEVRLLFDKYLASRTSSGTTDCLMLFDADDTLIRPRGIMGSSLWFFEASNYLKEKKNIPLPEAFRSLEQLIHTWFQTALFDLTEAEWPEVVSHIRSKDVPVLLVTGRIAAAADLTMRALHDLGYSFSHDYFGESQEVYLPLDRVRHHLGALHCGAHPKGEVLAHFMKLRHEVNPFKETIDIFFVDDREHYLDQVASGLEQLTHEWECSITYYRIHYTTQLGYPERYILTESDIAAIEKTYSEYVEKKR